MESRDHLSGLRAVGSAVLAAYVCCASLAGMAGTHLDVPPSVHADGESMLSGGVPAGTSGQSRKVRLEAWCVNAGTNQFEVQFASSPAATAETVEFVLGFDCGVWFARGPALASREEFPGLPVPEGEFQLRLDIRLAPDGSPYDQADWLLSRLDAMPSVPDAFVCANDYLAIHLMSALRKKGLRIPEDVQVTGFDGTMQSALMDPPLTTVSIPTADIGRMAPDFLLLRVRHPEIPFHWSHIKTEPVWRGSTKK